MERSVKTGALSLAFVLALASPASALFDFLDPCQNLATRGREIAEIRDRGQSRADAYDFIDFCAEYGTCDGDKKTWHALVDRVYRSNETPSVIEATLKRGCVQGRRER